MILKIFIQKGIENEIIDKTFENFENTTANWELESAKIFAKKKRLSNSNDREKNFTKLGRAGFSYEISKKILENI